MRLPPPPELEEPAATANSSIMLRLLQPNPVHAPQVFWAATTEAPLAEPKIGRDSYFILYYLGLVCLVSWLSFYSFLLRGYFCPALFDPDVLSKTVIPKAARSTRLTASAFSLQRQATTLSRPPSSSAQRPPSSASTGRTRRPRLATMDQLSSDDDSPRLHISPRRPNPRRATLIRLQPPR